MGKTACEAQMKERHREFSKHVNKKLPLWTGSSQRFGWA